MEVDTSHSQTIDLTGLPDIVVREVQQFVQQARRSQLKQNGASTDHQIPRFILDAQPTSEEFVRRLDKMASMSSGQSLPRDFSRADIYDDHD